MQLTNDDLTYIKSLGRVTMMGNNYIVVRTKDGESKRLTVEDIRRPMEKLQKKMEVIQEAIENKIEVPAVTLNKLPVPEEKKEKVDADHAKLAPSSMKMFKNCYASLIVPEGLPPRLESTYSIEGTTAHELFAAAALDYTKNGLYSSLDTIKNIPGDYTDEMREHVRDLIMFIDSLVLEIGKDKIIEFLIESKVSFSEHIYGTIDFGILYVENNEKRIYALDLKYGKGVAVPAAFNEQLMTYVLAIIEDRKWQAKQATLAIYQPRNREHSDEPLDTWTVDEATLKKYRRELKFFETNALKVLAGKKKAKEHPGEYCLFCRRKPICKAYIKEARLPGLLELDKASPLIKVPEPKVLTDNQLDTILGNADKIRNFIKTVEEYVAGRMMTSNPLPGWKLVAGRATRKWLENVEEVGKQLISLGLDNPYKQTLVGIGEAEKKIGKGKLDNLTVKSEPKPKLVVDTDPRPALNVNDAVKLLSVIETDADTF